MGACILPAMIPTNRAILQQAWVVDDLEQAAQRFSRRLGIGPFFVADYRPEMFENALYRGRPTALQMRTAICYTGDVQLELVQPADTGANCYRETVPKGQDGFHHLCFWSQDLATDMAQHLTTGATIAVQGRLKKGPAFAYIDATASIGCMIELLEYSPKLAALFDGWRQRCAAWQGGDLLVPV